jgi:hypothetical protein
MAQHGRSTIGLSGLAITDSARYVADWLRGKKPPRSRDDFLAPLILRFTVDDLKAYCLEPAGAGAAKPSSRQLGDWLWNETTIGAALYALRELLLTQDEERLRLIVANFMVPAARVARSVAGDRRCYVKVLTFDTGGTILDWHSGLVAASNTAGTNLPTSIAGARCADGRRRRSRLQHRHPVVPDRLLAERRIDAFSPEDQQAITQRWHEFDAWPDFAAAFLRLRTRYMRFLHPPKPVPGHRHCTPQWDRLGCGEFLRDAAGL